MKAFFQLISNYRKSPQAFCQSSSRHHALALHIGKSRYAAWQKPHALPFCFRACWRALSKPHSFPGAPTCYDSAACLLPGYIISRTFTNYWNLLRAEGSGQVGFYSKDAQGVTGDEGGLNHLFFGELLLLCCLPSHFVVLLGSFQRGMCP